MHFIGIIANENDFEFIKNETLKKVTKTQSELELLNIDYTNIEFIKNVKFELIIINNSLDEINKKVLKYILERTKYIMINTDIEVKLDEVYKINSQIITYGLNQKSTLTISSVDEEKILVCLQRCIKNLVNALIEPKEVYVKNSTKNIYNILIMFGILLIFEGKM